MKVIVFWILVTITCSLPEYGKDEFGRKTISTPSVVVYKRDTLSREFAHADSAAAFKVRAEKIKRTPGMGPGSQYIEKVWISINQENRM